MEREKRASLQNLKEKREERTRTGDTRGDTKGDRTQMRQQERRHLVARSTLLD